jgi:hypothetical protein
MSRTLDHAYFADEKGSPVAGDTLFSNKFKESSSRSLNFFAFLENPLDPELRTQRQPQKIPTGPGSPGSEPGGRLKSRYDLYIGSKTLKRIRDAVAARVTPPVLKISLLFGVGRDLDNLGLRFYFEQVEDRVLINIPGREPEDNGKIPRWNIGITGLQIVFDKKVGIAQSLVGTNQIKSMMNDSMSRVGLNNVPYKIATLAAYSTGYGGLNQTINEGLIPLKEIETVVYYDCVYRAEIPAPAKDDPPVEPKPTEKNDSADELDSSHFGSAFNTRRAITRIMKASKNPKIIAYMATPGGSPRYIYGKGTVNERVTENYTVDFQTKIDFRNQPLLFNGNTLAQASLYALALARCLKYALIDGQIRPDEIPRPFKELMTEVLPERGRVASSKGTEVRTIPGPFARLPGVRLATTTLLDWGKDHEVKIRAATTGEMLDKAITLVSTRKLMYPNGYPDPGARTRGGILHAALLPEFGWECLI